jgi:outer membrane lipoprotein SlyB
MGTMDKTDTSTRHSTTTVIEIPEAVGVFDTPAALQAALYDLRSVGFSRLDISVLGSHEALEKQFGTTFWHTTDLADDPDTPRAAFVSEEAIGELQGAIVGGFLFIGSAIAMTALLTPASTIAASIAAIAVGGSPAAVIGALFARRVGKHHSTHYAEQIEHGGILLWVRVRDKAHEALAVKILTGHSGRNVHVHGWSE